MRNGNSADLLPKLPLRLEDANKLYHLILQHTSHYMQKIDNRTLPS